MCKETKMQTLVADLFWFCLSPVALPFLTYEHAELGSVDQHVKGHKRHNAGQAETACLNLHTNLSSDRRHKNATMKIKYFTKIPPSSKFKRLYIKMSESMTESYQVIFIFSFTFHISMATNCIQGECI